MIKKSVLVVEDEGEIRELVSHHLLKEGYRVTAVASGEEALRAAEIEPPDLVLLDVMLPRLDGMAVCQRLRGNRKTAHAGIIMVTAKGAEADIVQGLNMGANDYVTKPFSPRVLLARVRAVLRRTAGTGAVVDEDQHKVVEVHDVVVHPGRHEVRVGSDTISLSSTEFRVLHLLASKPGWVFTRQQILDKVHGDNYAITDRAVDVQIVSLRKKLGHAGAYIETVRGVGYRFKE